MSKIMQEEHNWQVIVLRENTQNGKTVNKSWTQGQNIGMTGCHATNATQKQETRAAPTCSFLHATKLQIFSSISNK